MDWLNGCALI